MARLEGLEQSLTVKAIDAAYEASESAKGEYFTALGISGFGSDCDRALWYAWHKAAPPENHEGRMLRIFETGHREEARIINDLRRAGVVVRDIDEETRKQFAVSDIGGHLRGKLDGRCINVPDAPVAEHVLEIKTHNAKSFAKLLKDGVEKSKPAHWRQMQFYMHLTGINRSLYLAKNKDDDALYSERVEYDPVAAIKLIARAESIIRSQVPPPKLHMDPDAKMAFECRYCAALGICHQDAWPRRNCRTCLFSNPIIDDSSDAKWWCDFHETNISTDDQRKGCSNHLYIVDLVPGGQIDASEESHTVTYMLKDGSLWIDGADRHD